MSKLRNVCLFIALILFFSSGVSSKLKTQGGPQCGAVGQKCCTASNGTKSCKDGMRCTFGTCANSPGVATTACGGVGQRCCNVGNSKICHSSIKCGSNGTCSR